jgi:hypothetical protein
VAAVVGELRVPSNLATLQQFPLIDCVGLDGLEAGVARLFGDCALDAPRESCVSRFKSVINYRSLQHMGLLYGSYSAAFDAKIGPYDSYVLGFPISAACSTPWSNRARWKTHSSFS